jgi:hypothetical protein
MYKVGASMVNIQSLFKAGIRGLAPVIYSDRDLIAIAVIVKMKKDE